MRDKWTDERLDDLNAKVDRGFDRLDAEMRAFRMEMQALRVEMKEGFEAVNARFDAVNARIDAGTARIDSLSRTMLWFAGALIVAVFTSNLAILAAILTS